MPVLASLHWLPAHSRILFKVLLLVYKATHSLAPSYSEDIHHQAASRSLRSTCLGLLHVPRSRLKQGDRAFAVAGPQPWNSLPSDVRNARNIAAFKSGLKTHLFKTDFRSS